MNQLFALAFVLFNPVLCYDSERFAGKYYVTML